MDGDAGRVRALEHPGRGSALSAGGGALSALLARVYALRWRLLPPLTGLAMFALLAGALLVAPRESVEGNVQRLMYIHVPSANAAFFSLFVVFVASLVVLIKRDMRWDAVARGAATVGVLFTAFALATGAIWGRPIWGVYWTWDARLTSTLILFMIYGAYLLARAASDPNDEQAARFAAVFAVIGFLDIPLIAFSVSWWRTLHPQPIVFRLDSPAMPGEMLAVLVVSISAVLLLTLWLIALRSETERLGQRAGSLRALIDRQEGR